jgi:hypothetical protein
MGQKYNVTTQPLSLDCQIQRLDEQNATQWSISGLDLAIQAEQAE